MRIESNNNIIKAFGNIEDGDGMNFETILKSLESSFSEIFIKMHTYGGSVFDGNLMYNAISNSKAKIIIHIVGVSASMGAVISLATPYVYMVENGYLMVHAPSSFAQGTASDFESNAKLLRLIEQNFLKKLSEKTKKPIDYVKAWLQGDNWFSAEQALSEGLIVGILDAENNFQADFDPKKIGTKEALSRFKASFDFENEYKSNNYNMLRYELIKKFKLRGTASDTSILNKVEEQEALRDSLIKLLKLSDDATDEDILNKIKEVSQLEEEVEKEKETEAKALISEALRTGKIMKSAEASFLKMFKNDFNATKQILTAIPVRQTITSMIQNTKGQIEDLSIKSKSEWDLDDYRRLDPKALSQDPQLYEKLKKAKFNK